MSDESDKPPASKRVMQLKYDDEVANYYVSSNRQRTQLIVCIVTNRPMTNEDALMALDVFVQDAHESGINVIEDPDFVGNDH